MLGYTIRIGERVIRGEIEPRDQAEATYKEALYSGRTAGLLEQDRADTFWHVTLTQDSWLDGKLASTGAAAS